MSGSACNYEKMRREMDNMAAEDVDTKALWTYRLWEV